MMDALATTAWLAAEPGVSARRPESCHVRLSFR
jgi:hypothetical protein